MAEAISQASIQQLFTEARSHHSWLDKPVAADTLKQIYELMKWGPTSVNAGPARILFIQSEAEKAKLYPTLMGSNVDQVRAAPITAIVAYDSQFFDQLPKLFPIADVKPMFANNAQLAADTAFRNSSMQGAYLIFAARALGLDTCPMSGFDNAAVDRAFFAGTTWKSNFICTLGYGDISKVFPRGPRLTFEEACQIR